MIPHLLLWLTPRKVRVSNSQLGKCNTDYGQRQAASWKKRGKEATMFELLMEKIRYRFGQLPDLRKPSNRTTYTVSDAALSAFSVFFMQAPSFLAYQRQLQRRKGRDNAQ